MAQPQSSCDKQGGFVPAGEVACEETATCPCVRAADNRGGLSKHSTCPWWNSRAWEEVTHAGERTSPLPTLTAQTWAGMQGHVSWDGLHGKGSCCHPSEPPLGLLQLRNSPQSCTEPLREGASLVCTHLPGQGGLYSHFHFNSSATFTDATFSGRVACTHTFILTPQVPVTDANWLTSLSYRGGGPWIDGRQV